MRIKFLDFNIRHFLSADIGDGGGGSVGPTVSTSDAGPDPSSAPDPSAAAVSSPAQPAAPQQPQQQGPDWNSLGVPFDQAQQRLQYFQELEQRYKSDPAWAQQYDKLYGGQQQQQQQGHPYDWMVNADDKYRADLRQQGEQHPDFPRYQAEFGNFFQNPIGQLAQYASHPKFQEAVYGALQPQIQDLAQRMMEQEMGPIKQFIQQQGEQQFRQQYEGAWAKLPDNLKQAAQQGRFGDWNQNRHQAIINAVEFGKTMPQAAPAVPGAPAAPPSAATRQPAPPSADKAQNSNGKKWTRDDDDFVKRYAEATSGKK